MDFNFNFNKFSLFVFVAGFLLGGAAVFLVVRPSAGTVAETAVRERIDTVVFRDTVWAEIPVPYYVYVARADTVAPDGTGTATVPITRETYATDMYKATVEGYKPKLLELELYPKTVYITKDREVIRTVKKTWQPLVSLSYSTLFETAGIGGGTFYNNLGLSYEYQYSLQEKRRGHRFALIWKF